MTEIKNIEDLITPILGKDKHVLDTKTSNLTVAGDNYGSSMVKVDIKINNNKNETETIHAVAKMLPQNEFVRQAFNSQFTFRNEVGFYQIIAPCLRNFQKEQGLEELYDSFPDFYGARLSLNPENTKLDDDAVLLIKNIKLEGFSNVDRTVGFNLDQSKMILEKMAELHGTFMVFKSQKSEVFKKEVGRFFKEFKIFDFGDDNTATVKVVQSITDMIEEDPFCIQHMKRIKKVLDSTVSKKVVKNLEDDSENVFSSFVHSDMWSNNIMVKKVEDKTVDVKFVDYQIYEYSSLTRDVVFFLFTSVQIPVIKQHLDDLLNFYYEKLITWFKKLNYDVSSYSFEIFIEDMKKQLLEMEFFHIMLMLGPIYAESQNSVAVEEMSENALIEQRKKVSQQCKEKGCFIVKELITRGWL